MKLFICILFLITSLTLTQDYPLKYGIPTSKGIEMYIENQKDSLIIEYQNFVEDTLFDVWIYAKDLTNYVDYDSLELGRYWPNEVIISTATLFDAYELNDLSKFRKTLVKDNNKFVKSTIFHELTHHYFYQIIRETKYIDEIEIDKSYESNIWFFRDYSLFGSIFIEEGICEYMSGKMGEIIIPRKPYIPKKPKDLRDINNRYNVVYKYSAHYLKTFLDTTGFKRGVKILIHNTPPTTAEILEPELYFKRLKYGK